MYEKNRLIVAVGGPKGSGKTSVLEKAVILLDNFELVLTGRLLQKLSRSEYSKDFLSLSIREKQTIRDQHAKEILAKEENLLLDLHFGEFEDEGYPCVIPEKLLKYITHFILITTDIKTVLKRRREDNKKRRLDVASVKLNMLGESILFQELGNRCNVKSLYVNNQDVDVTVKKVLHFLDSDNQKCL